MFSGRPKKSGNPMRYLRKVRSAGKDKEATIKFLAKANSDMLKAGIPATALGLGGKAGAKAGKPAAKGKSSGKAPSGKGKKHDYLEDMYEVTGMSDQLRPIQDTLHPIQDAIVTDADDEEYDEYDEDDDEDAIVTDEDEEDD